MSLNQLHILCKNKSSTKEATKILDKSNSIIERWENNNESSYSINLIIDDQDQKLMDELQSIALSTDCIRLNISKISASFPKKKKDKDEEQKKEKPYSLETVSRESMLDGLSDRLSVNGNFISLVILSSILASIALIKDNIIILIGAMVLTPLLKPNLALSFSVATSNNRLFIKALITFCAGIIFTLLATYLIGLISISDTEREISKTIIHYGFESFIIAACAGCAATIFLMQGTLSSLIGVMVAVAFLPPLAMTGISLSAENYKVAMDAFLLFLINLASFNLASLTTLLSANIQPLNKTKSTFSKSASYLFSWTISTVFLIAALYFKS